MGLCFRGLTHCLNFVWKTKMLSAMDLLGRIRRMHLREMVATCNHQAYRFVKQYGAMLDVRVSGGEKHRSAD